MRKRFAFAIVMFLAVLLFAAAQSQPSPAASHAAVTIEHLGCEEWMDVASTRGLEYKATGKYELSVAITPSKAMADHIVGQGALMGTYQRSAGKRVGG